MSVEVSGVDLARQALVAAREQARKNGAAAKKKPKRRARQAVRRDGREPLGLGEAIGMMTERGLVVPAAGGNVLALRGDILAAAAPQLAGHVAAVAFDAASGRLDVAPDAPAYGTKLRWSTQALIAAANAHAPDANVRALHVLPPAAVKAGPAAAAAADIPEQAAPEPAGPIRTREDACDGYRQALAAHQAAKQGQSDQLAPAVRTAIERQDQVLRERGEAEEAFADGRSALEELHTKAARSTSPDHARARALRRLADERAGRAAPAPAPAPAPRRTA